MPSRVLWWLIATLGSLLLMAHWGMQGKLSRDASVYAYAGQQLNHGVPPYVSIFDPKGPLSPLLAGVGAWLGEVTGQAQLTGIRIVFGVTVCVAGGCLFLLARTLFGGMWPGVAATLALAACPAVAANAFSGPEAKAPVLLLMVVMMLFALWERWALAGVATGLACLAWQPIVLVALALSVAAWLTSSARDGPRGSRIRLVRYVSGLVAPLLACLVFFVASGSLREAFEATVTFPLTGIKHGATGIADRVEMVGAALGDGHWIRGALVVVGIAALYVVLLGRVFARGRTWSVRFREPEVTIVLVPASVLLAYCLVDFQGTPDLIALLPFAALGIGGLLDVSTRNLARTTALVITVVSVAGLAAVAWAVPSGYQPGLACQRAQASALSSAAAGDDELWAFGDPAVLVLAERRNPDRFIYLASGVAGWKAEHEAAGFPGWKRAITEASPDVAVFGGFRQGDIARGLNDLFADQHYERQRMGKWTVYTRPGVAVPETWRRACA